MTRQSNAEGQDYIPFLPHPESIHQLNPDELRRIFIDSFRFSQGFGNFQLGQLFLWLHFAYPDMRLSQETIDSALPDIRAHLAAILGNRKVHKRIHETRNLHKLLKDAYGIETKHELDVLSETLALSPKQQLFKKSELAIPYHQRLDTILVTMILADYMRLFNGQKSAYADKGSMQFSLSDPLVGRERAPSSRQSPDNDPWLSQICHYVFHQGNVPYDYGMPITVPFQRLMTELRERLMVLIYEPESFSSINWRTVRDDLRLGDFGDMPPLNLDTVQFILRRIIEEAYNPNHQQSAVHL